MIKSKTAILLLSIALLGSNAWWLYHAIDAGVTSAYREASWRENHAALAQALAILPVAAQPDSTPAQVLSAAKSAAATKESFQKDGYTWVGELGLRFDTAGRLSKVKTAWEPF